MKTGNMILYVAWAMMGVAFLISQNTIRQMKLTIHNLEQANLTLQRVLEAGQPRTIYAQEQP